jgi:SWI/SNF-related matrix-associated actin-dependent regulator 1 of chromatin subfamily A
MLTCLYNFQKEGIEYAINKHGRMLIADEMGVGKTIQAIGISYIYKAEWPVLILAPSSLKYNWRDEILEWLGDEVDKKEIQIIKATKDNFKPGVKFYILSYDLSIRIADKIEEMNFNFAICDEAHYMKNKDAKRTQLMTPILQRCKRLLLLSGTPILAKPLEIFTILKIIRPDIFQYFKPFGARYCDPKLTTFGMDYTGSSNVKELYFILSNLMIRRLKKDVLSELPPKKRQKVEIQTDTKVVNQIKVLLNKASSVDLECNEVMRRLGVKEDGEGECGIDKEKDDSLNCFTKAYSLTGRAKLKGIVEYINYLIDSKYIELTHR